MRQDKELFEIKNFIEKYSDEKGLHELSMEWKYNQPGTYVAHIKYRDKEISVSFSAKEIEEFNLHKVGSTAYIKIYNAIDALHTGNKGPQIKP